MKKNNNGTIYLVGAGPGDPDLLTVKAKRLLTECDALVYDALIPKEFLKYTPDSCRHFFVGKRRGNHSLDQKQINKFLVEISKDHNSVVRLKGGDPFLFGRGCEEAEWLIKHNIQVQVVPGITSGMAAPTYMGIPLTHRETASSVTFVTGHEGKDKKHSSVKWRRLANASDGIVIYMGMHNLNYIINELIAGGLDPETPSAIIHQATLANQQYIKAPLNKLLLKQRYRGIESPSIIVIGKVITHQIKKCAPEPTGLNLSKLNNLIALKAKLI
ncbi:uroporphyrinogen-III C-methyltransferase [Prochlorococcus sp. MIT 1223]|uniref:uroporphyrinogen-III C-methyltransferase n=1 Tax=Prochlorococcus sp. MIT 1223 TaxID=3096217 RepID=UPI002A75582D|nr:uroporphyrinogen-III C-methyltransferase [Prochlorococcus sp. MIT 1223]